MSLLTQWSQNNYDTLLSLLSKEDKEIYTFAVTSFDWDKYVSMLIWEQRSISSRMTCLIYLVLGKILKGTHYLVFMH